MEVEILGITPSGAEGDGGDVYGGSSSGTSDTGAEQPGIRDMGSNVNGSGWETGACDCCSRSSDDSQSSLRGGPSVSVLEGSRKR